MNGTRVNKTLHTVRLTVVQNLNETQTDRNHVFHSFDLLLQLCKVSFVAAQRGGVCRLDGYDGPWKAVSWFSQLIISHKMYIFEIMWLLRVKPTCFVTPLLRPTGDRGNHEDVFNANWSCDTNSCIRPTWREARDELIISTTVDPTTTTTTYLKLLCAILPKQCEMLHLMKNSWSHCC